MSAAFHVVAAMFATVAAILTYIVHIAADHPRVNTWYLVAIVLLLGIPLIGAPDAAGTLVLTYLGILVCCAGLRRLHRRERTRPSPATRAAHRTRRTQDGKPQGKPQVFKDQNDD